MAQRIYLAGPFFSNEQVARLKKVRDLLEANPTVGYIYEPVENQQDKIVKKYGTLQDAMHEREWQT